MQPWLIPSKIPLPEAEDKCSGKGGYKPSTMLYTDVTIIIAMIGRLVFTSLPAL